ncbi:MAG: phage holin family protein [Propionibacteriaceae bacterium]|jgi:hypothetical protein|nr:phage holin family protein [Propionibacteriaceae bacterium]
MSDQPHVAELLDQITADVRGLVADEIALAKAELRPTVHRVAAGSGLGAAAACCAATAILLAWFAAAAGLAWLYASVTAWSAWACAFAGLASAFILALGVAALTALLAYGRFKGVQAPQLTPVSAQQAIESVKSGFTQGRALIQQETSAVPAVGPGQPDNPGSAGLA